LFDQHFGFQERTEDFAVEAFIPELVVEAFNVAVFPRAARFDIDGFDLLLLEPVLDGIRDELRSLSLRRCSGTPYLSMAASTTVMASTALIDQLTCTARHCRVYSSIRVSILNLPPPSVWSSTKSQLQTSLGRVARWRRPVLVPRRVIFLWRLLTRKPSWRRTRATRLGLNSQSARRNSAVIRR
jgi:hypothetical protein